MTDDELADLYTDTFVATRDYEAVAHLASLRAVAQRAAAEALEDAADEVPDMYDNDPQPIDEWLRARAVQEDAK